MTVHPAPLATIFTGWEEFHQQLIDAITPLTADQLDLRAAPHLRPITAIVGHIIATRVSWFHYGLGVGDESIRQYSALGRSETLSHDATELVAALQATWALMRAALDSWSVEDMTGEAETKWGEQRVLLPRQWVIWHVIEHDLHHGGEVLLTLGVHQIPTPDVGPVDPHVTRL